MYPLQNGKPRDQIPDLPGKMVDGRGGPGVDRKRGWGKCLPPLASITRFSQPHTYLL